MGFRRAVNGGRSMASSYPPPPGETGGGGRPLMPTAAAAVETQQHQPHQHQPHQQQHQQRQQQQQQQQQNHHGQQQSPSPHAAAAPRVPFLYARSLSHHHPQFQSDGGGALASPTSATAVAAAAQHTLLHLQATSAAAAAAATARLTPTSPDTDGLQLPEHQQPHYPPLAPSPHSSEQQQRQQHDVSAGYHYSTLAPSPHGAEQQQQHAQQQQHNQQAQHPYSPQDASPTLPVTGGGTPVSTASSPVAKATRLRRACDICSARKVKCDEFGPPCNPCKSLGVDCTWSREMKRRGPPNKHAEAARAKRARLEAEAGGVQGPSLEATPTSGSSAAGALVSIATPQQKQQHQQQQQQPPPPQQRLHPQEQQLDAESIAPWPTLELLVDDFYTYINPLIPFPHEPTFRRSFAAREDRTDPEFLALLASMICCLVASFPRAARLHLKAQQHANLFPRAIIMVERCRAVALSARGAQFHGKQHVTVYDAATSYFLGLSAGYTLQWRLCRRFMAECLTFVRELGFHRPRRRQQQPSGAAIVEGTVPMDEYGPPPVVDHVVEETGKRLFYIMLVGVRSMVQIGAAHNELVFPPPTATDPYPELPVEVDDEHITQSEIRPQPAGTVSLLTAFNQGIKIYMTMNSLISIEVSYGINSLSLDEQQALLARCLHAVKHVSDDLPKDLRLNLDELPPTPATTATHGSPSTSNTIFNNALNRDASQHASPTEPDNGARYYRWAPTAAAAAAPPSDAFVDAAPGYKYFPPAYPDSQPANDLRRVIENQPARRRLLQFEIQKANIYTSQLATRSYYVERYFTLRDLHRTRTGLGRAYSASAVDDKTARPSSSATTDTNAMAVATAKDDDFWAAERELIVQHLLSVVASITQRNMEPNGSSLINKVRQVASTLLNDVPERRGPLAVRSEEALTQFLDILMRLEKTGSVPGRSSSSPDGAGANSTSGAEPTAGANRVLSPDADTSGVMTPMDEEEELRSWADLREFQMRFAQNGGFITGNL